MDSEDFQREKRYIVKQASNCTYENELQFIFYVLKSILQAQCLHIAQTTQNKYCCSKGAQAANYACLCAFCHICGVGCRDPPVNRFDLLKND